MDARALERQYVHEVYDEIAESFSDSRYAPWPGVMRFLRSLPPDSWGADIGCGNGKYLISVNRERLQILPILASDPSLRLLNLVRNRGFDATAANILSLPYRPGLLDFFICVAVLHHLATPDRRLEGLRSMASLLKIGGLGLIQVWARDQRWDGKSTVYIESGGNADTQSDVTMTAVVPGEVLMAIQKPRAPFVAADVLLPWNAMKKGELRKKNEVLRYYHVFEKGELENLVAEVPCLELVECVYEKGNWCALVRKVGANQQ